MTIFSKCAQLSSLAYQGAPSIELAGYTNICAITSDETGAEAFVCEDDETIFVAFVGTDDIEDVQNSLRYKLTQTLSKYKLHTGFFKSWQSIASDVGEELLERTIDGKSDKDVVFTGHSLGGAMAVIAGATYNPHRVVTFGQPEVGGRKLKKHMESQECTYTRVVFQSDPVPRILFWNKEYRHGGRLVYVDNTLRMHINPSSFKQLLLRLPTLWDMSDHDMSLYRMAMKNLGELVYEPGE